jgi:DNA-binding response OmpR family regulator
VGRLVSENRVSDLNMGAPRILLVLLSEQEGLAYQQSLTLEGFDVALEADFERGAEQVGFLSPSLVVLDLSGASPGSLEVLLRIRRQNPVPILVVTDAFDSETRIGAMELGADGCIGKPCDCYELASRIRAILRRCAPRPAAPLRRLAMSGVTLDPGNREVCVAEKTLKLTTIEFDILEILMRFAGRPVSRESVIRKLYNRDATGFDRSINVHISNLRKKLESSGMLIKAVRGTGYQFCVSGTPIAAGLTILDGGPQTASPAARVGQA